MEITASPSVGYAEALKRLRMAQKSSAGAPPYSLYVNRPLGRYFAAAAYRLGLTPNQVTLVSALCTFSGIVVLAAAPATWLTGVVVAALLVVGYALDSADGQLARLRGGGSPIGEWLDHVVDSGKIASLHLAVLVSWALHSGVPSAWWYAVPIAFSITYTVHFFGMLLTELLLRVRGVRSVPSEADGQSLVGRLVKLPTDYGTICVMFLLLGAHEVFRWVYLLMALAAVGHLALALRKWARKLTDAARTEVTV